jgi:hypothetical protein
MVYRLPCLRTVNPNDVEFKPLWRLPNVLVFQEKSVVFLMCFVVGQFSSPKSVAYFSILKVEIRILPTFSVRPVGL